MSRSVEELEAEIARLKAKPEKPLTIKIAPKGGLSVYGLQHFPVTLYKDQWQRLADFLPDVLDFIVAHDDKLKNKDD